MGDPTKVEYLRKNRPIKQKPKE